jgi:hypothetical protein
MLLLPFLFPCKTESLCAPLLILATERKSNNENKCESLIELVALFGVSSAPSYQENVQAMRKVNGEMFVDKSFSLN